jgi:hypothetical protein
MPLPTPQATPLAERLLIALLFLAMLVSSVAFVEPSPHDFLIGLLFIVAFAAGLRVDRPIGALFLLLVLWNAAGLFSLMNIGEVDDSKSVQYVATSIYLSLAAVLLACVMTRNTMTRMAAFRAGYVASAFAAAVLGIIGYLHLAPGSDRFLYEQRAVGLFKDPNVYGPYLIWPALIVMSRLLQRLSLRDIVVFGVILVGILFSFSRGAWGHFLLSGLIVFFLMFVTAQTPRARMKLTVMAIAAIGAAAMLIAVMLSIDSVRDLLLERAHVTNSYDVGEGGRFQLQELALKALLDFPNGMGPFGFAKENGLQQHNVYLQAFMVYGWVGGFSYLVMVLSTFFVGARAVLIRAPWQNYLIAAYATFIGEALEGLIIDTDHWRHYFVALGLTWGLAVASYRHLRQQRPSGMAMTLYAPHSA